VLQEGHRGEVTGVAFHPDGRTLVSSGVDKTIKVWDSATGVLRGSFEAGAEVWGVGLVSGGQDVAYATTVGCPALRGALSVRLNLATGEFLTESPPGGTCRRRLATNRAGDWLVCADEEGDIAFWGAGRGWTSLPIRAHRGEVTALAVRDDGAAAASAGWGSQVALWDPATGRSLASWKREYMVATCLAFAPAAGVLAAGYADGVIVFLDAAEPQPIAQWETAVKPLRALAFSPDGLTLVTGADGGVLTLWDVAQAAQRASVQAHQGRVAALAFNPDGSRLATGGADGAIRLWTTGDGSAAGTVSDPASSASCTDFSTRGGGVATGDDRGVLRLWDPANGALSASWQAHDAAIGDVALDLVADTVVSLGPEGPAKVWSIGTQELRWQASCPARAEGLAYVAVAASDGAVVIGCRDGQLTAHDAATGDVRSTVSVADGLGSFVVLPGAKRAVTASWAGPVQLWDLETGSVVAEKAVERSRAVAASPGGRWVAFSVESSPSLILGETVLWDMSTLETRSFGTVGPVSVAFEPAGDRLLATTYYGPTAYLFDSVHRPPSAPLDLDCPPAGSQGERLGVEFHLDPWAIGVGFLPDPPAGLVSVEPSRLALVRLDDPAKVFLTTLRVGGREVAVAYTQDGLWDSDDPEAAADHLLYRVDPDLRSTRMTTAREIGAARRHAGLIRDFLAGSPIGSPVDMTEFPEPILDPPCSDPLFFE
jgi:WD40 repeat protein